MKRGEALLAQKDYSRAILEFRNAAVVTPKDAEPQYQMGKAYLAIGDLASAVRAFQRATALNPKHSDAQLKLAELMMTSRNDKVIEESASRLQSTFGDSPSNPEVIDAMAVAEWKLGKSDNAMERLSEALTKFPTHLGSSVVLARMKFAAKDWQGAEEVLKKAVAEAPQSSPAETALGDFYVVLRQPTQAEAELKKAAQLDPRNGAALVDLGRLQIASGKLGEAEQTYRLLAALPDKNYKPLHAMFSYRYGKRDAGLAELERLAKSYPKDRDIRTYLVAAYLDLNRKSAADAVLTAALKQNPKDVEALEQRAEVQLRSGMPEGAEKDLMEVLHFKPDSATAHFLLGLVYSARDLPDSQQQELQAALKSSPTLLPARLALTMNFVSRKHAQAGVDLLDQAPEDQKKLPQWMLGRTWALIALGKYSEAKTGVEQVLANGRPPAALYQSALLHFLQHDPAGARALIEELLKDNVADVEVSDLLMQVYDEQHQPQEGLKRLRDVVAGNPKSAPLRELLGEWLRNTGDTAAARRAFESAKTADPHYIAADLSLAQLDMADGGYAEALQKLNQVVSANPKNVPALVLSAEVHGKLGARAAEIASYRAVLDLDQSNTTALNNLAYILATDNPDEAIKLAQQAAEMAPENPYVQDTLGWIYYRRGSYSMAVQCLKIAVDSEPTPRRQFRLGMAYLKAGDRANGEKIMSSALQKDPTLMKTEQGW